VTHNDGKHEVEKCPLFGEVENQPSSETGICYASKSKELTQDHRDPGIKVRARESFTRLGATPLNVQLDSQGLGERFTSVQ